MNEAAAIADLFEKGRIVEIGARFDSLTASGAASSEDCAFAVYLSLHDRGKTELAIQFMLSFVNTQPAPNDALIALARRVHSEHDQFVAANLFMSYVNNGGKDPFAYDAAIMFAMTGSRPDLCIAIHEKAQAQIDADSLMDPTLFNIATCLAAYRRFPEAVALYKRIIARSPDHQASRANLTSIAKREFIPEAIQFFAEAVDEIAQSLPSLRSAATAPAPIVLDWETASLADVEAAVNQNGFCFLRNACHVDRVLAFRDFIFEYEKFHDVFPVDAAQLKTPPIEPLYKFDAKALMSAIFQAPGVLDLGRSILRRVTPARQESFVPYHQDSTAFAKSLINIWTPLTPAGGEHPSLELVAKRVTRAEQTLIYEGEYNLVEIAADYVQERYEGLIYEVADARPGDCVIFLGTTIHRSANLAGAVKPRYNLEARWSETG